MDSSEPTPRVNAAMLKEHVGKKVRLVGKVMNTDGSAVTLEAADGGTVTVKQVSPHLCLLHSMQTLVVESAQADR